MSAPDKQMIESLRRENEIFERAIRIQTWNDCKNRGLSDEAAYANIKEVIDSLKEEAALAKEKRG